MFRVLCIVALFVSSVACGGDVSFPVPPQRVPVAHPVEAVLRLAPDQGTVPWVSILQDVLPPAPTVDWRWTRAHPAFEFHLMDSKGWRVSARLTIVGKVLAATGPQHVTALVNGTPVGSSTFAQSGNYDLSFPVQAAVLKSEAPIVLRLDIDPCLPADSPSEKSQLYCVLLHSIGFIRDAE